MQIKQTLLKLSACTMLVFSAAFLSSCKKNGSERPSAVNESLVREVQTLSSVNARKLAFVNMLNPKEKAYLLHQQITYILQNVPLETAQKALIEDLDRNIPEDLYQGHSERDSFMQRYGNQWKDRALSLLGNDFIREYFTQIATPSSASKGSLAAVSAGEGGDDRKACKCSSYSEFCGDFRCTEQTIICKPTEDIGCGLFFLYQCNGLCGNGTEGT